MRRNDETGDQFAGTKLPGTGGDFLDETDVEGHRRIRGEEDAARRGESEALRRGEPEALRRSIPDVEGDDVEGHRRPVRFSEPDELYRGGPTTQGEIIMRGPGDNPHGDR